MSTGPQRIPRHQPQRPTITTIEPRGNASQRGYDVVWKRLRLMVLRREPLCRRCGAGASQVSLGREAKGGLKQPLKQIRFAAILFPLVVRPRAD